MRRELSPEARARLSTLADHTELGAGFAIAMRDLEIRGAGELLGAEQSGHVAAVGFELYVELLPRRSPSCRASAASPRGRCASTRASTRTCRPSYIGSEALKIDLHRRLALSETEDELRELHAALEDRYGPLPEPVENLFAIQEAKLKLALLGADYLVFRGGRATVGPLVLGSGELRELRTGSTQPSTRRAKREVSLRSESSRRGNRAWSMLSWPRARQHEAACELTWQLSHDEASLVLPRSLSRSSRRARRLRRRRRATGARPTPSPSSAATTITQDRVRRAHRAGASELQGAEARLPEGGHAREYQALQEPGRAVPRPARASSSRRPKKLGVNVTDKQVETRLAQIKKQYFGGSEKKYKKQLKAQGLTEAQVRDDITAQLISEKIFAKVTDDVKVTDKRRSRSTTTTHKAQYGRPESRDVRHILVKNKALADQLYGAAQGRRATSLRSRRSTRRIRARRRRAAS